MSRHVPLRTCVGCRRTRPKHELVRFVAATGDDAAAPAVRVDATGHFPGRGAYVCPDRACADAAARRGGRSLRHALRGAPEHAALAALASVAADEPQEVTVWP